MNLLGDNCAKDENLDGTTVSYKEKAGDKTKRTFHWLASVV